MVIAVSIFALMGVIAFGGLGQMTRTGQAVADANDRLADLQFADEEANIVIENDAITFTRSGWSNLLGQPRSTLQRVQYLVVDNQLVRRHWRSLDQGIAEQPIQVVLLDNVESMEIGFQNALKKLVRVWPPEPGYNDGDPILLAVKLELPDMGEILRLLEVPSGVI
jgi:general secretion pathway protein J